MGAVGIAGAAAQVFLTVALTPKLLPLLLGVWAYMALMFREFFAADRLRSAPILYAVSHMVVMLLIVFYIMAAAWTDAASPAEIAPLLATAFFVGLSAEIGRKIRAPQDEQPGVETYSALFGRIRAVRYWLASLAAATGSAVVAAISAGRTSITIIAGAGLLVAAVTLARYFTNRPSGRAASAIEYLSGAAVVLLYSVIGLGPILGAGP